MSGKKRSISEPKLMGPTRYGPNCGAFPVLEIVVVDIAGERQALVDQDPVVVIELAELLAVHGHASTLRHRRPARLGSPLKHREREILPRPVKPAKDSEARAHEDERVRLRRRSGRIGRAQFGANPPREEPEVRRVVKGR